MGAWGPKLYEDDLAADVRDTYMETLRDKGDKAAAYAAVFAEFSELQDDPEDGPILWFALADTMWYCGHLTDEIRNGALFHLEDGADLERWRSENPQQAPVREKTLAELKARLLSPQPPEKKVRKPNLYVCPWAIGDVYAYPLDSKTAVTTGFEGCSLLFHKVGTANYYPGHTCPVVRVKIVRSDCLPLDTAAFAKLPYLKVWSGMYHLQLLNTSKRATPKKLQYIGCFSHIPDIPDNWIPQFDVEYPSLLWKWFDEHLLNRFIKYYGLDQLMQFAGILKT